MVRQGEYPGKRDSSTPSYGRHRVVVPVYVPELSGYFADAERILGLVLESLRRSTTGRAVVTVVANRCHPRIVQRLREEQEKGWLDALALNLVNRGKVDAQRSAAQGSYEDVVTLSDGDVLFHQGWLEAVHEVFEAFPQACSVAPSPNPRLAWSATSATVLGAFIRRELGWESVVPEEDLLRFAESLDHPEFFHAIDYRRQLVVRRRGTVACVGNGHFCVSLRREVVSMMPRDPSRAALGLDSEITAVDRPPDLLGGWKLATPRAWVRHLGNVAEDWMEEELATRCPELEAPPAGLAELPRLRRGPVEKLPRKLRSPLARVVRRGMASGDRGGEGDAA